MRSTSIALAAATAALLALGSPAVAQDLTEAQRAEVQDVVRTLLLDEPELIADALRELERRRRQEAVDDLAAMAEDGGAILVTGPEDADIVMYEFTDYNCPFCRRAQPEIAAFLEHDPNVRRVVILLPYIGSDFAERASLAAMLSSSPESVEAFHNAMMSHDGQLSDQIILQLATTAGVDIEAMLGGLEGEGVVSRYEEAFRIAQAIGVEGTPAFVMGGQLLGGLRSAEELIQIAEILREDAAAQ